MAKAITICSYHNGHKTYHTGTVEELRSRVFGYKLECGHSWNPKISLYPKTGKAIVKALNQSVQETQSGCYNQDNYELID